MTEEKEGIIKSNVILDPGSGYIKAGFAGEENPSVIFPSCVAYPKKACFIGSNSFKKSDILEFNFPIQNGFIKNYDNFEMLLKHAFTDELKVNPEDENVMITEAANTPKENREKLTQFMFEIFNINGFYISSQAFLSLCSEGSSTGVVLDSGEGVTQFVPIYEGYAIPQGAIRRNFGGSNLNKYLEDLLFKNEQKYDNQIEVIRDIKEKACYVALDFMKELKNVKPYEYTLPDGKKITIKEERVKCAEGLFNLDLIGIDKEDSIAQICFNSIQKCDIDTKKELYNCVVLSGGSSMFTGFSDRLCRELKLLVPPSMKEEVNVFATAERKYSAWCGGSILTSVSTFESNWITKSEFEEYGVEIVHKKCV